MCDLLHLEFKANYNYCEFFFQRVFIRIYFHFWGGIGKGESIDTKPCHIYQDTSDKVLSTLHKFF